jgi:hypothetical protein
MCALPCTPTLREEAKPGSGGRSRKDSTMRHSHLRFPTRTATATALALVAALGIGTIPAQAEERAVDPNTLTPTPPDFFNATCAWTGGQIQCDVEFVDPISPLEEPTGITCGTGTAQFEVLDTWSRSVVGKRVYNGDGLLVRRRFNDRWDGTFTNSVTGATADYEQRNTYLHDLAVPGAPGTGIERQTTHLRLTTPHGSTVLDSGHVVISHDDDAVVFASGKHALADYFDNGDASAVQPICDALS